VFEAPLTGAVCRRLLESTGCLFVKQRAGYLSYAVDPKVALFFTHYIALFIIIIMHNARDHAFLTGAMFKYAAYYNARMSM